MLRFAVLLCAIISLPSAALVKSNWKEFENDQSQLKAVVFLSSTCPCSRSHVSHLNQLSVSYPEMALYGVITDRLDAESESQLLSYYSAENFQFPVLKDQDQKLTIKYSALKTPHVVLLRRGKSGSYETLYEGGVSDKRDFEYAKKRFLAENLEAIRVGRKPRHRRGQSLGCYIRRFQ
ncbi:MAG: redoxin domain-containing protein [Bdellovibrionales bacterium]|nr:redoxin domain-containing protein [Bdellovibrionales bacterium]